MVNFSEEVAESVTKMVAEYPAVPGLSRVPDVPLNQPNGGEVTPEPQAE
jgi:hypothetical protein